uniref:Uncharacterized protein n=1 Tax=Plectus sambesii TaxID=2011161 RepID=A0A914XPW9_9BILA
MRVVGVRLMKKQTSTAPLSTRSATTVNHTDEDTAQLLDDLEEICSDCSVDEDASSDERVEPEPPRSSGSATSQQNPRPNPKSLRAESSIGSVNEVNSQMTAWRGIGESQREESPCAVGAESEPRPTSTPQMSAFGSSDGSEECRAKELLKRIMDCKGVIELIATEDALLMRDIYFFDRCQ